MGNVPCNFLKCVCTQNFLCATFYQHSSIFRSPCMKYVQTHFLKENLCALQVFLCAFISQHVCARTCAQLRGNIAATDCSSNRYNYTHGRLISTVQMHRDNDTHIQTNIQTDRRRPKHCHSKCQTDRWHCMTNKHTAKHRGVWTHTLSLSHTHTHMYARFHTRIDCCRNTGQLMLISHYSSSSSSFSSF